MRELKELIAYQVVPLALDGNKVGHVTRDAGVEALVEEGWHMGQTSGLDQYHK